MAREALGQPPAERNPPGQARVALGAAPSAGRGKGCKRGTACAPQSGAAKSFAGSGDRNDAADRHRHVVALQGNQPGWLGSECDCLLTAALLRASASGSATAGLSNWPERVGAARSPASSRCICRFTALCCSYRKPPVLGIACNMILETIAPFSDDPNVVTAAVSGP